MNASAQLTERPQPVRSDFLNFSIATRLSLAAGVVIALMSVVAALLLPRMVEHSVREQTIRDVKEKTAVIGQIVSSLDVDMRKETGALFEVFVREWRGVFTLSDDQKVQVGDHTVASLMHDDQEIANNFSVVDRFKALTGAVATVLVRVGDDFLGISTAVKNGQGERANGTKIGKTHPAHAALIAGNEYLGRAVMFNVPYMTKFRAIKNADGQVVGALFVGADIGGRTAALEEIMSGFGLGESGQVYAIDVSQRESRGTLVVHPTERGVNILNDDTLKSFAEKLLSSDANVHESPIDVTTKLPGKPGRVAVVSPARAWDWLIVADIYPPDLDSLSGPLGAVLKWGALGMVCLVVAVIYALGRWMVRRPLTHAVIAAERMAGGDLSQDIRATGQGEARALLRALGAMQADIRARQTDMRATAATHLLASQALDDVSSPVRIADPEGKILYVNKALREFLKRHATAVQAQIPGFDADKIVGSSIGVFYPDAQAGLKRLASIEARTVTNEFVIGGRRLNLVTTPVFKDNGERVGTVGEWRDETDAMNARESLGDLIQRASQGDFSRRMDTAGIDGSMKVIAEGVNGLLDTTTKGLDDIAQVLAAMAEGRLDVHMANGYQGLFGTLSVSTTATVDHLAAIVAQIRATAESIDVAAAEIARGNGDLSARTEEQAASVEETSSSIEAFGETIRTNAGHAERANELARSASAIAERGGSEVERVVTTMSEISASSKRIADIISVIDGIAFQTNILALNAAVEAARAGAQGRGFAVVAAEVRELAQKSAAAAREIKSLIADSVSKVAAGTAVAQNAGSTMADVVQSVRRVTDIMAEIAAGSAEQRDGVAQFDGAVKRFDHTTQQNAALVEQAAAAAESLRAQAQGLIAAVGAFKVADARHDRRLTVKASTKKAA